MQRSLKYLVTFSCSLQNAYIRRKVAIVAYKYLTNGTLICNRRSPYIKYCENDESSLKCMKLFCTTRGNIKGVQKILSKRNNKSHLNVQNWA